MERINMNNIIKFVDLLYIFILINLCKYNLAGHFVLHIKFGDTYFFSEQYPRSFFLKLMDARLLHEYDSNTIYC